MTDIRADLLSGDAIKQTTALMAISQLLAAGRDASPYTSLVAQAVLASPAAAPMARRTAYDLLLASPGLGDADWARMAAAVGQDLQKGSPHEVRVKALEALPQLPSHRLAALLADPQLVLARLLAALRSPSDAVRAAAMGAVAGLAERPEVAAAAAGQAGLLGALMDLWEAVPDALTDETDIVVAAACAAVRTLLTARPGSARQSALAASAPEDAWVPEHERATAAGVQHSLQAAVQARLGAVLGVALARFATLGSVLLVAAPPLLVAYLRSLAPAPLGEESADSEQGSGRARLSALPGELPALQQGGAGRAGAARGHAFEECTSFLVGQLHSVSSAAAMAAAEALLELTQMEGAPASVLAALPTAASAIISTAAGGDSSALAEQPQAAAAQPRVLALLAGSLRWVPAVQQPLLFRGLVPLVAGIPQAEDRARALAQLWSAAMAHDWAAVAGSSAGGGGGANGGRRNSTPQLQQLLLEPGVREVVSGSPASPSSATGAAGAAAAAWTNLTGNGGMVAAAGSALPAFREELVGTLLYVLLTHPRVARATAGGGNGAAAASGAVAQAAALQAAQEAGEWLASAKLALLGTKACLGWDRMAGASTTGTTAAVDLWLQLLLCCLKATQATRAQESERKAEEEAAGADVATQQRQQQQQQPPTPLEVAQAAARRKAAAMEMDLQGLLLQIAANWRALHPAVRPRAVWLCCCHLQLKSVPDAGWNSVVDAIRGLLVESRKSDAAQYWPAVAEGILALPPAAASSAAAAPGQAAEVALLCLERVAAVVAYNAAVGGRDLAVQLAPVASLLERLVRLELEGGQQGGPALRERLGRVSAALLPVATSGKQDKSTSAAGAKWTSRMRQLQQQQPQESSNGGSHGDGGQQAPLVVKDLLPPPAETAAAAYPLTLPSSSALFDTPEAVRYRRFLHQLQDAVWGSSSGGTAAGAAAGGAGPGAGFSSGSAGAAANIGAAAGGLPSLLQLTEILNGSSAGGGWAAGPAAVEVTGPSTPLSLLISHTADPGGRTITLHCRALNRTVEEIRGVEVELTAGGPLAASSRRPLSFRLEPLPPAEGTSWEASLRVVGFGWPTVQAAVRLPVKLPSGEPVMRCRPYTISPLQLLAPPSHARSPAEFYQQWQSLPHRASLAGTATGAAAAAADGGAARVLQGIEGAAAAGLCCVHRAAAPAAGTSVAAFHGTSWDGQAVGLIVVAGPPLPQAGGGAAAKPSLPAAAAAGPSPARLQFFFRSEAPEMIAHIKGHQGELLDQLTGGLVIPAASGPDDEAGEAAAAAAAAAQLPDEPARPVSTFSFLRGYTGRDTDAGAVGGEAEEEAEEEGPDQAGSGAFAVEHAALAQWQRLWALQAA